MNTNKLKRNQVVSNNSNSLLIKILNESNTRIKTNMFLVYTGLFLHKRLTILIIKRCHKTACDIPAANNDTFLSSNLNCVVLD